MPSNISILLKLLYAANGLWHTGAFYSFALRTEFMMRSYSTRIKSVEPSIRSTPAGDEWHHDLLRNLGFFNIALALLAYLRLLALLRPETRLLTTGSIDGDVPLDVLAFAVLAAANGAEAYWNFTIGRGSGRWRFLGQGWDLITVGDAVLTALNTLAVAMRAVN